MRFFVLAAFVSLVLIGGCVNPHNKLLGNWKGSTQIYRPPTGNASLDQKLAENTKPVDYSLELREDMSYTQTVGMNRIEGTWTFRGGALTLTPESVNGNDPKKERTEFDEMNAKLHIQLPIPEGTDGPKVGTVSDDYTKITLPSIGTTVELSKSAK